MTKMIKLASLLLVVVLCVGILAACGGMGSYEKKLEKAGYEVEVAEEDDLKEFGEDIAIKSAIGGTKGTDMVAIYECASKDDATKLADAMKALASFGGVEVIQDGKIVIMGTEAGVAVVK